MKIIITADNTCDLTPELIEKHNIKIINIPVIMGDNEIRDSIKSQVIYDYVAKTGNLPKTAALSIEDYKEFFAENIKDADAIIHFALSYALSSTGPNAEKAAKELGKEIYVIDTKSLSSGSGLLVLSAIDKINEGKDAKQIVDEINTMTDKIQASFLISKLNYLKKGGRCSGVAAFGANLLGLKVLIELEDGKMKPTKKYMGKINVCLAKYLKEILNARPANKKRAFVTSSSDMGQAQAELIQQVKDAGFEEVYTVEACPTICSHCGPETIGVLYECEN